MRSGRRADVKLLESSSAARSLSQHWPEYLMEAAALGIFMISAGLFTTLFEARGSQLHAAIPDAGIRRFLIGVAMGMTAMGLIYCPWGRRSGAHMNPSVTLAFLRLGKVPAGDVLFYILFQFLAVSPACCSPPLPLAGPSRSRQCSTWSPFPVPRARSSRSAASS